MLNILKKKKLEYLRSQWGKPIDKFRNFDLISIYHNNIVQKPSQNFVDEKTWSDLNFDSIFSKMDRNVSCPGQQYLYHLLHKYEKDEKVLKERFEQIQFFKKNSSVRESIQISLSNLANVKSYFIPSLIISNLLHKSKFYYLLILLSISTVVSSGLIYFQPQFLFVALALLLINVILNRTLSAKIYNYFAGFSSLFTLLIDAKQICKIKTENKIRDLEDLHQLNHVIKKLKKRIGLFVIDKEGLSEPIRILIEYLNLFFLFDLIAYFHSVNILNKYRLEVRKIYESVAGLDACISIASYLEETQSTTNPVFNVNGEIGFINIYHPLLDNPVPNTIDKLSKSALITGSNMSGKTTFIRCVGINLILAQTLYFCHADKLETPKYIVKTAIKREEDLENSKSYFFVEVEALQNFIRLAKSDQDYLFLIDEIFRGTNTVERLAISTAVLEFLGRNEKVLVTTHDIELQGLLENNYEIFHFGDQVEGNNFYFDYKIQQGVCLSGNAIKLLVIKKYPQSITQKANEIANELLLKQNKLIEVLYKK